MATSLFPFVLVPALQNNGTFAAGAKIAFYLSETTTLATVYDADGDPISQAANGFGTVGVSADAFGRFPSIYLDNSLTYRAVLRTAAGVQLGDEIDPISDSLATLAGTSGSSLIGFIQSGTGATPRTVQDKLRDFVGVTDFGGAADGTTDNSGAVTAAQATGRNVVFQSGVHKFNSNVTIRDPIILRGATLKPASGVTLTIAGTPVIPLAKVFDTSLGGTIVIDPGADTWGLPEWWGAVTNTGVDCYAALMACYAASRQMELQSADYYVSQTVIFDQPFKRVRGKERDYNGVVGQASRLIILDGTSNVLQIGPTTMPVGGFNAFPQGIEVSGIWVTRAAAPSIASGCIGITVQYVLRAYLEDVASDENITGFLVRGTVDTEIHACRAFRSLAGTGGGADKWWGFDIDGSLNIGAAGGNASIRITNCRSAYGGTPPTNSIGCNIHGAVTDTFVKEFEDVTDATGLLVNGLGPSDTNLVGNMDVYIDHPVCDQNKTAPIHIQNINPYGSVEVNHPYAGASTGASAGILLDNCTGTVKISGGQVPMIGASGTPGISADTCTRLYIDGTIIMECSSATGAVVLSNCGGHVAPVVSNFLYGTPAAILVVGSSTNALRLAPVVGGNASTPHVTHGIQVNSGAANNSEYNVSAINKTMIAGAKLTIAGVDQGTPGVVPAGGTCIMTGPST